MRILHLYAGNLFGGIETYLITLAKTHLPHIQHEFALCFEERLSSELQQAGAIVHPLGAAKIRYPWTVCKARSNLKALLHKRQFDVVIAHACWVQSLFGSVVKAQNIPLVFYAHDTASGRTGLEQFAKRTIPDLVLANSRYTQSTLANLYPDTPSRLIYCPVLNSACSSQARHQVRSQFQTPLDRVVIIQACRLEPWKGHRLLLSALAHLRTVPNWEMWIVGGAQRSHEKTYLAELQSQAETFGLCDRVQFLGQRSDVPQLLAAADIHCQPNIGGEPFGIAFIEALYAGLPIITTAIGAAPEIVNDRCGYLVPAGDSSAIAQALEQLITDTEKRDRLSKGCIDRAIELCDPERQLHQLYEILDRELFKNALELSTC
ncbi:glycosyltransferase family 4 protein [Pseudanabaenaceae cyanobacterium LEGE 13415]|nr:glycosyltransferase family 4 protein [Pseudanabaenaceae cyanobacterium LEGE 13415]